MDDFNDEENKITDESIQPDFDVDEIRATSCDEQLQGSVLNNKIECEETGEIDCLVTSEEGGTLKNNDSNMHPFAEPERGNKKKGLFLFAGISVIALIMICNVIILFLNPSSIVSSTFNKLIGIIKNEPVISKDVNTENANTENGALGDGSVVNYPACEVELGEYLGITVTAQKAVVTEDEVEAELSALLEQNPILIEVTNRSDVQSGDIVTIDYVGSIDGVAFDGGSDQGYPLEIGAGNFIEGFEEKIVGHKVGENFDIQVTFPESYAEELAGKEAVFNITVHGIGYYEMAEANDEFIAANTEYKTLVEYKKGTYDTLLESAKQASDSKTESDIINTAVNNATFINISSDEVDAKKEEMMKEYESYAGYYGLDLLTFASYYFGMDETTFYSEMTKAAEIQVKTNYFLKKVIEAESIVLTDEEYKSGLEEYAQVNGFMTTEEFETYYGRDIIEEFLIMNKAYNVIIDSAVIIE